MSESVVVLMEAAAELARTAGAIALEHYRRDVTVETKGDGSPVTIADRRAEAFAREWITRRFSHDGILGEEFGVARPGAARRWIVDPIDGTRAFVRGVPLWGTLVAVAEGSRVLTGAAFYPAVDELIVAGVGEGCWWNGARCAVSRIGDIGAATLLTTDDRFPNDPRRRDAWRELAARSDVCRTWGDCYGYLLVATGRAETMVDDVVSPWDAAAFAPIIVEAGGVLTDWAGIDTPFGNGAIATNALLAREVRGALGVAPP
jgi:histidinol phosphatase-like enzyme (inositol monophosphatase family)